MYVCLCMRFVVQRRLRKWEQERNGIGTDGDVLRRMLSLPSETQNNLALKCAQGRAKKSELKVNKDYWYHLYTCYLCA